MSIPNQKFLSKIHNIPYFYNPCTNVSSYDNIQHDMCYKNDLPSNWKLVKSTKKYPGNIYFTDGTNVQWSFPQKNFVNISHDKGKTWNSEIPEQKVVLIIGPGAGTFQNSVVYDILRSNGYKLLILKGKDGYPNNWQDNKGLDMYNHKRNDLLSLAKDYTQVVGKLKPSMLICGSRGCQVTLGKIWEHFWRGPSLIINGGCLVSDTLIPNGVFPVLVTATNDYFPTKNDKYVRNNFKRLSEVPGVLVRLLNSDHMPQELQLYILGIVILTSDRELNIQKWKTMVAGPHIEIL